MTDTLANFYFSLRLRLTLPESLKAVAAAGSWFDSQKTARAKIALGNFCSGGLSK